MKHIGKAAIAAALLTALSLATPSYAGNGRAVAAGAAAGFVAGAVVGSAAANSGYGYGYAPGYYAPGYYGEAYAYEPVPEYTTGYVAVAPASCWHTTDSDRGFGYYGSCAYPSKTQIDRLRRNQ